MPLPPVPSSAIRLYHAASGVHSRRASETVFVSTADRSLPPTQDEVRTAIGAIEGAGRGEGVDGDRLDSAVHVIAAASELAPELLARETDEAAGRRAGAAALGPVNDTWISCAIVGQDGIAFADSSYLDTLSPGGPTPLDEALSDLRRRCARTGSAYSVLPFPDGRRPVAVAAPALATDGWPLPAKARLALKAAVNGVAVLAFAPWASGTFAGILQHAFALTQAEADLAAVIFDAPTIQIAGLRLGIAAATAKDHMRALFRKTGARRRADLATRLTDFLAGDYVRTRDRVGLMREAFALTATESRVADAIAGGYTTRDIARDRGVSPHTVRAQLDSALAKTGATRGADLARIVAETCALTAWTSCSETHRANQRRLIAATRMVLMPDGRRIAATDYGPAEGTPVLYLHAPYCYRWVRRSLADALQASGFRPVSYDRADCGLSDAAPGRHPFDVAADDAQSVLAAFGVKRARILTEFGGAAAAIALAARWPDLVDDVMLLMPRALGEEPVFPTAFRRVQRSLMTPLLGQRMGDLVRLVGGTRFWQWAQTRISQDVAADPEAMADPVFVEERVGEMNASISRTLRGITEWDRAYLDGRKRPAALGGRRWTVVLTGAPAFKNQAAPEEAWGWLPGLRIVRLPEAGRLATHTHARELTALLD